MSVTDTPASFTAAWLDALQSWTPPALAPRRLEQDINSGWRLGDVYFVSQRNSSSPETEREIVSEQSYGRQIGRIMDALAVLVAERDAAAPADPALAAFTELKKEVERIKTRCAGQRLEGIVGDLGVLRREQPETYKRLIRRLAKELE